MRFRCTGEEKGRAPDEEHHRAGVGSRGSTGSPTRQVLGRVRVGHPCDGCDEPILDTQVEYEVAFDAFPTVRLHAVCAEIWGALVAHAGPAVAGGA